jgi:uncharacterized protein YcbX
MLISSETKRFISQRQQPKLAQVQVDIQPENAFVVDSKEGFLSVTCDQMGSDELRVPLCLETEEGSTTKATVWEWTGDAYDCGEDASRWFTTFLGVDCRLVRFPKGSSKRGTDAEFAPDSETAFSDGFPYLIASQESLQAVNKAANGDEESSLELPMNRFRPNLVVTSCGPSFDEDTWNAIEVSGGSTDTDTIQFDLVKPCSRCTVTTVNQSSGEVSGKEPLRSLGEVHSGNAAGYGRDKWSRVPFFGWNAVTDPGVFGRVLETNAVVKVLGRRTGPSEF